MIKIFKFLKAIYFSLVIIGTTLIFANLVTVFYLLAFRASKTERNCLGHSISSIWGKSVVWLVPGWKVFVEGKDHLSLQGNKKYVFVANHESATDIFVMYFTNLQFRWLSKASVFKIPLIGRAMRQSGYIPIERGNKVSHKESMEKSAETIKNGIPMLYFPEGTRSETGDLNKFKIGAFKLASETGAEVVPICLLGTKNLLNKGSIVPGKAEVKVKILEPTTKKPDENLEDFASRVRDVISAQRT